MGDRNDILVSMVAVGEWPEWGIKMMFLFLRAK